MPGTDRTPVPPGSGGGKKRIGRQVPSPISDPTPDPTPGATPTSTPNPNFTVDCFGPGARFAISTQATGPGPIGNALGGHDISLPGITIHIPALAPNPGDVPDLLGLSVRVKEPVPGMNVNNYQTILGSLRKAHDFMQDSAVDSNELRDQKQVIECFENFCKSQGWPVFSAESH